MQEIEKDKDIVFADRFWGSTIAFDVYGNGVPPEVLDWVGEHIEEYPDITLFFSAPLEVVRQRKRAKTMQRDAFSVKVEQGYEELAKRNSWIRIDATQKPEEVAKQCLEVILSKV